MKTRKIVRKLNREKDRLSNKENQQSGKLIKYIRENKIVDAKKTIRRITSATNLVFPLFAAVYFVRGDIIKLLLQARAPLDARIDETIDVDQVFSRGKDNKRNVTQEHVLSDEPGLTLAVKATRVNGLRTKASLMHMAIFSIDSSAMIKLLLEQKADHDAKDYQLLSPLAYALQYENIPAATLLLDAKADTYLGVERYTLLCLASFFDIGTAHMVQWLIENKADINEKMPDTQETALHIACRKQNRIVIDLLMERNADPMIESKEGIIPGRDYEDMLIPWLLKSGHLKLVLEFSDKKNGKMVVQEIEPTSMHMNLSQDNHIPRMAQLCSETALSDSKTEIEILCDIVRNFSLSCRDLQDYVEKIDDFQTRFHREHLIFPKEFEEKLPNIRKLIETNTKRINDQLKKYQLNLESKTLTRDLQEKLIVIENYNELLEVCLPLMRAFKNFIPLADPLTEILKKILNRLQEIDEEKKSIENKKIMEKLKLEREENKLPLIRWHLLQRIDNLKRSIDLEYKIFWKFSEIYSRKRRNQSLYGYQNKYDFSKIEASVQKKSNQAAQTYAELPLILDHSNWHDFQERINHDIILLEAYLDQIRDHSNELHSLAEKIERLAAKEQKQLNFKDKPKTKLVLLAPAPVPVRKPKQLHIGKKPPQEVKVLNLTPELKIATVYVQEKNKKAPTPNLADILNCVYQISRFIRSVEMINNYSEDEKIQDPYKQKIYMFALFGMIVRFNSFLHSNTLAFHSSQNFPLDTANLINQMRNNLFQYTGLLDRDTVMTLEETKMLGGSLRVLLNKFAFLIGVGHRKDSRRVFSEKLQNFNVACQLLEEQKSLHVDADALKENCWTILQILVSSIYNPIHLKWIEIFLNALLFIGGLLGKITSSTQISGEPLADLAQARHSPFPDFGKVLESIHSLWSQNGGFGGLKTQDQAGEFDLNGKSTKIELG